MVNLICPKCGGLMRPVREGSFTYMKCVRCGYKVQSPEKSTTLKVSSRIEHSVKEKTVVVEEPQEISRLPITRDVTCKKCGHNEAYYWVVQTRAADEPPTRFYKCAKCGYVWREYE